MKLNEFICPLCGRRSWDDAAYTRCDGCGCVFYLSQSAPIAPSRTAPAPFYKPLGLPW